MSAPSVAAPGRRREAATARSEATSRLLTATLCERETSRSTSASSARAVASRRWANATDPAMTATTSASAVPASSRWVRRLVLRSRASVASVRAWLASTNSSSSGLSSSRLAAARPAATSSRPPRYSSLSGRPGIGPGLGALAQVLQRTQGVPVVAEPSARGAARTGAGTRGRPRPWARGWSGRGRRRAGGGARTGRRSRRSRPAGRCDGRRRRVSSLPSPGTTRRRSSRGRHRRRRRRARRRATRPGTRSRRRSAELS